MQIFAKRFWGFDPKTWPIIAFHLEGNRDALVRQSRPGDRIAFIGTNTEETALHERGRFLGIAEIGRIAIDSADVLDVARLRPDAFDAGGRIRWPKALPMIRAWRFVQPPRVTDVLREQLSYEATVRAVLLDDVDAAAVLAIEAEEVPVIEVEAIARQRRLQTALQMGGTTGPRPSSWTGQTGRDASEASFTYALQFGRRDLWKVGHAKDLIARLADVNRHVPSEILGEEWRLVLQQAWQSEMEAYEMEQRVLVALHSARCVGERVSCSKRQLESAWTAAILTSK
jgi:hypothetical protein